MWGWSPLIAIFIGSWRLLTTGRVENDICGSGSMIIKRAIPSYP